MTSQDSDIPISITSIPMLSTPPPALHSQTTNTLRKAQSTPNMNIADRSINQPDQNLASKSPMHVLVSRANTTLIGSNQQQPLSTNGNNQTTQIRQPGAAHSSVHPGIGGEQEIIRPITGTQQAHVNIHSANGASPMGRLSGGDPRPITGGEQRPQQNAQGTPTIGARPEEQQQPLSNSRYHRLLRIFGYGRGASEKRKHLILFIAKFGWGSITVRTPTFAIDDR